MEELGLGTQFNIKPPQFHLQIQCQPNQNLSNLYMDIVKLIVKFTLKCKEIKIKTVLKK